MHLYSDPQTKFPIPNEKKRMQAAPVEGPSRKIAYKGADPSVGKLPVNPDGLMWRGKPAITTQQLLIKPTLIMLFVMTLVLLSTNYALAVPIKPIVVLTLMHLPCFGYTSLCYMVFIFWQHQFSILAVYSLCHMLIILQTIFLFTNHIKLT